MREKTSWVARGTSSALRRASRIDVEAAIRTVGVLAAVVLLPVEATSEASTYDVPLVLAFGLSVLHAGSLALAAFRPRAGAIVSVAAVCALQILSVGAPSSVWPWSVPALLVQTLVVVFVGLHARRRVVVTCWLAATVMSGVVAAIGRPATTDATSLNVVTYASVTGGAMLLAIVFTQWRQIRDQLLTERRVNAEEYSRRVLAEERARIARELHDVIAHSMSMINVQATTARYRHPAIGADADAVREFDSIAGSSRQALEEMRGVLSVLRDERSGGERAPQPRFADIPDMVAQSERSGMHIRLEWLVDGDRPAVGDVAGLAAYRIVQEALSNVSRHAPATEVTVRCEQVPDVVRLSVANTAPAGGQLRHRSATGHGLRGMTERAASVAGRLTYGETADGGFAVEAVLPLTRVPLPGGTAEA